jgi:sulfite reductase alpha subunit-like flavoprotein
VCTTWLCKQPAASNQSTIPESSQGWVAASILKSAFKLPADPSVPVIMVAGGVGIGPMKGFIDEREVLMKCGKTGGPLELYFGNRNPSEYAYQGLIEQVPLIQ